MKKFIILILLIICGNNTGFSKELDYQNTYLNLSVPTFSYVHAIDPGQYYDMKYSTWSPYPLLRLSSPLYFKTITIVPGYYDLTPVTHKGDQYMLFKQQGLVRHIIPVYDKEIVPEGFYESHLPQPKLTFFQKLNKNWIHFAGAHFKSAQRKPIPQAYLEVNDLENKFVSIVIYFGPYRYYTIFRTVKL